jgi:carbon-monoxide dehydrogenase medium subunit
MYPTRPAPFAYHRPASVEEAVALLREHEDARPLAGGHSLLPAMKLRLATPAALVDIGRIADLRRIETHGERIRIGALATHVEVAASPIVREGCPVLATAASLIGDRQVRNRGTVGGSLANADPGADYPTVVRALEATVTAVGPGGSRELPAAEFFTGVFATALAPGELVTELMVPARGPGTGAAYLKHKHPASGYAVAAVAAVVSLEGGRCREARVVVGGVTGVPTPAGATADALAGSDGSPDALARAAAKVPDALGDAFGDYYASADYRVHLASVLAGRALAAAFEQARA